MSSIFDDIFSDIKNVLASGYKLTRIGLTDLFTDAAALGRETGDLIFKHKLIPFNKAIQDVENQSVANTPVFSGLAKFGIKKGSQLFNAGSQLAANIIPVTGTFGHLAAHPGESLPAKISDIAFGLIDIPGLVELADTGRLLLTGADELSPIGRVAEQLGNSKAFNLPLIAAGIGSIFLPGKADENKQNYQVYQNHGYSHGFPIQEQEINLETIDSNYTPNMQIPNIPSNLPGISLSIPKPQIIVTENKRDSEPYKRRDKESLPLEKNISFGIGTISLIAIAFLIILIISFFAK